MAKDQKTQVKTQAKTVAKKIAKPIRKRGHAVRTKPRFYRTLTLEQKRSPKVLRTIKTFNSRLDLEDPHLTLIQPLSSDKNMARMENENTITFLVAPTAGKVQIKAAFQKLYSVKVRSVNTLIRADGKKKAFVRLAPESEALKVANKIGLL
jgi:large subunit ribosomal protein L23Ae